METRFRQTPAFVPEHVAAPAAAPAPPALAPAPAVVLEGSVEAVLALQRTAGNQATIRALSRAVDERTATIEQHVAAIQESLGKVPDDKSTPEGADAIGAIFGRLAGLDMPLMLDVCARLRQLGALGQVATLLPQSTLDEATANRVQSAIDGVNGKAGTSAAGGDVDALDPGERDAVGAFGPAKVGTSGDDPDGNTYVVYSGLVKTYFMTTVEPKRRSSVWLANNPGNSDQLGGMGTGSAMKWGAHQFAIFATMTDGRKALWEKIQTKPNLQAYLNYHLGQQPEGGFADGNDPNTYLQHIQSKLSWAQFTTTPKEIEDKGASELLLDGFMTAEGIVPGKEISAGNAQASGSMTAAQQKTMTFYLKLLGLRS
jgi:hypothetical protein